MNAAATAPWRAHGTRSELASRLALAGATLGVVAGLVELTFGPSVREWAGDKQDTTRLGLATAVLSTLALVAATALRRRPDASPGRLLAIALALALPALVCFTTAGRLWYLPGVLLLAAAALVVTDVPRGELAAAFDERRWRIGLLAACGAFYIFLGATALGAAGIAGVLGGMLIWAVPRIASRSRPAAGAVLLAAVLPFATATWWSVITPVIAVTALLIGQSVIRRAADVDE